jgi:hypothetical protein
MLELELDVNHQIKAGEHDLGTGWHFGSVY